MVQQTIYENAHVALDQTEYQKRYDNLTQRFETAKQRLEEVIAELDRMQTQRADIEAFVESFEALPDTLTEFKLENWHSLVEYATVYSTDDIRFTFKHGQEDIDAETPHHWIRLRRRGAFCCCSRFNLR